MMNILSLTKRNLLLFFRNKSEVFFSLLSVIIILGLYILFIGDIQVAEIEKTMKGVEGAAVLVNSWVMAGLIAVSTVTLAIGSMGRFVADREKKSINDFLVTPTKRSDVLLSYLFSTTIITLLLSLVIIVVAEIYIASLGGAIFTLSQAAAVLGIIVICTLSSTLMMLFIVSFFKNSQAMSVFGTVIGTMIGFITGAYMPIGIMPKSVQIISNLLPASQGASLLRKIMLEAPMSQVFVNNKEAMSEYAKLQGVNLYFGTYELTIPFMVIFIIGSIVLFGLINYIRFKKMKDV